MPFRLIADAGGVEIEIFQIRAAAGRDEKMSAFDRLLGSFGDDVDLNARQHAAHLPDLHTGAQRDAFAGERVEHDGCAFRIGIGQRRRRVEHGDFGAEPAKRLRQLEADGIRANDNEMARALGEIEYGFVGEMRRAGEPGNGRQRRRGAGRNNEASRFDVVTVDRNGFGIGKAALAFEHAHAKAVEAFARILRRDRGDDVMHMGAHRRKIDAEARTLHAEARAIAEHALTQDLGALGRREQRLGRQRAAVEALAAHLGFFDQHHIDAEGGRRGRRREAARAGADDADVRFDLLPLLQCHFVFSARREV